MVPGVIGSDVDIGNIVQALRWPLIQVGASFRRAELEGIGFENRCVTADDRRFPYDHLVLALGGQPNFFGIPGVEEHSLTMRGLGDAQRVRAIDGSGELERFEHRPLGRLVELGGFAVKEVMGVRFSGLFASFFWRATYLFKLESPQNRAQVAADWLLGVFFRPAVTQIRDLIEEGEREPDEARSTETTEPDGRQGARVGPEGQPR